MQILSDSEKLDLVAMSNDAPKMGGQNGRRCHAAPFSIKREGDRVFAQLTGQSYLEIFPRSETEFFYKVVDAQLSFMKDKDGKATSLTPHQNGIDQDVKKVSQKPAAEKQE